VPHALAALRVNVLLILYDPLSSPPAEHRPAAGGDRQAGCRRAPPIAHSLDLTVGFGLCGGVLTLWTCL